MYIWGLTGGIASGKTTVARLLGEAGVPVVGADALYHALIAPQAGAASPLAQQVAASFGAHLLGPGGQLDRPTLAAHIFADAAARQRLDALTHPAIAAACAEAFAQLSAEGHPAAAYDVPLLYEKDLEARFHAVVVVWVPLEVQLARLRARDGLSAAQAEARLAAQLSLDSKRARAAWCIDNSGSPAATAAQVGALATAMRGGQKGAISRP